MRLSEEIQVGINQFSRLSSTYPKMNTKDVIELLKRAHPKTVELEQEIERLKEKLSYSEVYAEYLEDQNIELEAKLKDKP